MDTLRLTPCGRISAGRLKRKNLQQSAPEVPRVSEYICLVLAVHGVLGALRLVRHLGLSNHSNLQKTPKVALRARRGSKGISSAGRRLVRDAATLFQRAVPRSRCTFATLTIPPSALVPELLQRWTEIVRKLRQRVLYRLEQHGLAPRLLGVVEIQERRQSGLSGLPALHLHLLFEGRTKAGKYVFSPKEFDSLWSGLLSAELGRDIAAIASCRLETVKSSCANYLGKYMSKGVQALSHVNPEYLPPSWYICTRNLLHWVRKETRYLTGAMATELYEYLLKRKDLLKFSKTIEIVDLDGQRYAVGWYGELLGINAYQRVKTAMDNILNVIANGVITHLELFNI